MHGSGISIWFFIGVLLAIYGVHDSVVTASMSWPPAPTANVVLANCTPRFGGAV